MKRLFTLLFLVPLLASGAAFMPWLKSAKGPSGAGGTPVAETDDFNRSDGAIGANWLTLTGYTGTHAIEANKVRSAITPAEPSASYWDADTFAANQYSQVAATNIAAGFEACVRVSVRNTGTADTNHNCYYGLTDGTNYRIEKSVNGTVSTLVSGTYSFTPGNTLRLEVSGTTLTLKDNGSTIDSTTDNTHATGKPGFALFNFNGQRAGLDDWAGGDL